MAGEREREKDEVMRSKGRLDLSNAGMGYLCE